MKQCVLVVGNPFDGLTVYGPFNDAAVASEIPDRQHWNVPDWWVVDLETIDGCVSQNSDNLNPPVSELREQVEYPGWPNESAEWPRERWREDVADCRTYLGYWEWVSEKIGNQEAQKKEQA